MSSVAGVEPLVSAIVPAFNAEAWIEATLRSVAAQTWRNMEILIVDDGSTDRTAAIAEAFCAGEKRARLIRKPNGGVASARNAGIASALGDYLAPVDADDLWHPTKIEKQLAAAAAAPEPPGFVYCWNRFIDQAGCVTGSAKAHAWQGRSSKRLAAYNAVGNGSALLIRAEAARAVGGYDESLFERGIQGGEDALIQHEIAALHPIACVPEYLVGYRVTAGAMSSDPERMYRSWAAARALVGERHGAPPGPGTRWAKARRLTDLAEGRAHKGQVAGASAALARALSLDPARVAMELLYRTARLVRRVAGASPCSAERRPFEEVPTIGHLEGDAHAVRALFRLLERWDRGRLARLALEEK